MCIAFPQGVNEISPQSRLWNYLAGDTLRLLSVGGLLHLVMLAVFVLFTWKGGTLLGSMSVETAYAIGAVYGAGAAFLFGVLLHYLPEWSGLGPYHRLRREGVFLLSLSGFMLLYWGESAHSNVLVILAGAIIASAWLLMLGAVRQAWQAARGPRLYLGLILTAVSLGILGLALSVAGLLGSSLELQIAARCTGLWGFLALGWAATLYRLYRPSNR